MQRRDFFLSSIALPLIGELPMLAQGPAISSDQFRKAFLEKFPWTEMCTTAEDAMMLRILIESHGAKRGVEVGGNVGYGAIGMGIGFERTGGHLYSVEIDPANVRTARKNLESVGLSSTVTVIEGDALKVLPTLEGGIDFVFIDALKPDYMKYYKALEPKLTRNAVVVADNVVVSARQMRDFLEYMQSSPNYDSVVIRASLHKNDGMLVAFKIK
ncbi:MAG: class I SAM-dependent methyltransferase [Candidatus Solibacter sp.]|nr:class I SAM-dependent methyltransferase [Candidatus Solibacter sp.]